MRRESLLSLLLVVACGLAQAQSPPVQRLTIKEAVQLALRQNPQLLIAELAAGERDQQQRVALSALLPQAGFLAGQGVKSYNMQSIVGGPAPVRVGPFQAIGVGPAVSMTLFDLPLLRSYQASRDDARAAGFQESSVREQITEIVVARYLAILRAAANRDAAAERVDLAQRLYDQAVQLQKNGVGTDIDALRAQVELQNEKQRLIDAETQRNTAIYALAQVLDLPRGEEPEPTDTMEFSQLPEVTPETAVSQALRDRPEMKALLAAEHAAELREKAAGEQRVPTIQVSSGYTYQARKPDDGLGAYSYALTLNLPLWTSGRISAEHEKAALERQRTKQQTKDVESAIEQQVRTALDQLKAARQSVEVAELGLKLAREEVQRARRRFEAGVATNIEVVTAQSSLARADDNHIEALYRFNQARADLARSTGDAENVYGK